MAENTNKSPASSLSSTADDAAAATTTTTKKLLGSFELMQTIGKGEFGKVKVAKHTKTDQEVAIKLIEKSLVDSAKIRDKVDREIAILKKLAHPSIVKVLQVIESERYIGIVMEYGRGGELFDYVLHRDYLEEDEARPLFAQIVSAVDYMHRKGVVHRDLKLENVLMLDDKNIILTDFGFANEYKPDDFLTTCCGSPCYAAPELLIGNKYKGPGVDVWSCGVVLYAILCGYLPFDDHHQNINLLYKDMLESPPTFPTRLSQEACHLIRLMLQPDPAKRCTLDTVMAHPWFSDDQRALFNQDMETLEARARKVVAEAAFLIEEVEQQQQQSSTTTQQVEPPVAVTEKPSVAVHKARKRWWASSLRLFRIKRWMRMNKKKRPSAEPSQGSMQRLVQHRDDNHRVGGANDVALVSYVTQILNVFGIQVVRQQQQQEEETITRLECVRPPKGAIYGDPSIDDGHEVVFSVTITPETRRVDVERIKGNPSAYDFLCKKFLDMLHIHVPV